ncbi:MAG TPA: hypothetical protein VNW68_06400 [Candidatus Limnocylindria bacterium]|jgi:hypothetical protein|nr:hypothetical protein [Candidatus Limnocylindria bacterium]
MKPLRYPPLVALLLAAVATGPLQAATPTPWNGSGTWADNQLVEYDWHDGSIPPAWMRSAINAAAADSNSSRASNAAILRRSAGAASTVYYRADLPEPSAIAYASTSKPTRFRVWMRTHGYVFDWGKLRWCQYFDSPPNGCYDAEMIALHEFGHVQGLAHATTTTYDSWTDTVMHQYPKAKSGAGWDQHAFGRCDVARLQRKYGLPDAWTLISTCDAQPANLTLSSSSSSVTYNGGITFTARLSVADSGNGRLAGQPLSGRSVVLQFRRPGESAWTTYSAMTPLDDATGRYRLTFSLRTTYEWRARFAAPAKEGIGGANSSIVTVTVASCTSGCPF